MEFDRNNRRTFVRFAFVRGGVLYVRWDRPNAILQVFRGDQVLFGVPKWPPFDGFYRRHLLDELSINLTGCVVRDEFGNECEIEQMVLTCSEVEAT